MTSKKHSTCTAFLSLTPSKARADILTGTDTRYYLVTIPHVTAGGKKTTKDIAYRPCSKQVQKDQVFCINHHKQQKVKEIITWKDISGTATCLNPVKKETTNADTDPHLFHIHQPLQFKMTQKQQDVLKKLFPVVTSPKKKTSEEEDAVSSSSSSEEEEEEDDAVSSSSSSEEEEEEDAVSSSSSEEEEEEDATSSSSSSSSEEEVEKAEKAEKAEDESESSAEESDRISVVELLDLDVEENKKWETIEKIYSYSLERCVEVYIHTSTKPLFYDEKMNVVCDGKKDIRGYMIPIQLDQAPIIYDGQFYTITRPTLREGMVLQRCQYSNRIFALNKSKKWVFVGTEEHDGDRGCVKWNTVSV